jgi:hypothetical protein
MDSDSTSRIIRLPTFDGNKANFALYSAMFSAYATMHGFSAAIQEVADANLPDQHDSTIDETTPEGLSQANAKRQNACAFTHYTMSFTTEDLLNKIESTKTEEWLEGLAHLVKKELVRDHHPKDTISRVEMRMEIGKITMGDNEDPAKLNKRIRALQNRYPKNIDADDLVATILTQAPKKYTTALTMMQRMAARAVPPVALTVQELIKTMADQ